MLCHTTETHAVLESVHQRHVTVELIHVLVDIILLKRWVRLLRVLIEVIVYGLSHWAFVIVGAKKLSYTAQVSTAKSSCSWFNPPWITYTVPLQYPRLHEDFSFCLKSLRFKISRYICVTFVFLIGYLSLPEHGHLSSVQQSSCSYYLLLLLLLLLLLY